jgi:DNA-binding winged helix-turn-helix (wHTH) protein/tetratricopeptide (TPR) repeat protein
VAVRFGDCELSVERREVRRGGEMVAVEPQVFDVLAYLVRHRDRVVPKGELLDEVWGDRFVSESALTSRIKSARRAIGDTGRDQRAIKTVHSRGYRFVADVVERNGDTGARGGLSTGARGGLTTGAPRGLAAGARGGLTTGAPGGLAAGAGASGGSTGAGSPGDPTPGRRVLGVLDDLAAGRGTALRVEGGARPARTELLHRLADAARARGVAVGMAAPSVTGVNPFACLAEALDEMTQRRPDLLDAVPERCRAELEQVFVGEPPTTRQRWLVAVRELLTAAADSSGAVLLIDHLDHATPEALALIDDVARLGRAHRVAVVTAGRPHALPGAWSGAVPDWFDVVELDGTGPGGDRAGEAAAPAGTAATVDGTATGPLAALDLPAEVADALRAVALAGDAFDELDLRAATGHGEGAARRLAEMALAAGAIVAEGGEYRFAEGVRAADLAAGFTTHQRASALEASARALADAGAPPERVAERFLAAGRAAAAAPYALAAARRAAAIQFHRDVLRWTEVARDHVSGEHEAELLALRADALSGVGDPGAVAGYRAALAAGRPGAVRALRARMARAALVLGDVASAQEALAGLEPDGGPDDVAVLYAKGLYAYFTGDVDTAEQAVDAARALALSQGSSAQLLLDAITLQGMVAHHRGEWFDRLRRELRATSEDAALASAVFDSHLCVAEYLLYGPTPYDEVIALTARLRRQAESIGARPAAAFATVVAGEAALLAGDLPTARAQLTEAVELHAAIGADTGTSHALQRLAEVELADGNRAEAERLLRRALPLARWSPLAGHLLQRIYGTLVAAAPDSAAALALVDEAVEASDKRNLCLVCHVMIAVPAAIACAEAGRLDDAHEWLAQAAKSAALWEGTAWRAAVREAEAHVRRAEGDAVAAGRLLAEAAQLFDDAGQPLDAQRCRESADALA